MSVGTTVESRYSRMGSCWGAPFPTAAGILPEFAGTPLLGAGAAACRHAMRLASQTQHVELVLHHVCALMRSCCRQLRTSSMYNFRLQGHAVSCRHRC